MKKFKIKVGDSVKVMSGEHKNETGKIIKIDKNKDRVIVEGVNMVSKHVKPSSTNPQGGIIKKEASIHISNVALTDKNGQASRVGYRPEGKEGQKVRFSKKTNEII